MQAQGHEGRVTVFGPQPLLSVIVEVRGDTDREDLRLESAGQGVWVARMAGELGATPVVCGLLGGETGDLLAPLLDRLPGERRMVETPEPSGFYVFDRRGGEHELIARSYAEPASREHVDELFSVATAAALDSEAMVVCNPYPGDALPLDLYAKLVTDVRQNDVPVIVDLSSPRLDGALEGAPDLVKVSAWELGEYAGDIGGDIDGLRDGGERVRSAGAHRVLVTRGGEPALLLDDSGARLLETPRFDAGYHEGCGDSMVGAIAAGLATGLDWDEALVLGAAAGAANFLRYGLGSASRNVVEELRGKVELRSAGEPSAQRD